MPGWWGCRSPNGPAEAVAARRSPASGACIGAPIQLVILQEKATSSDLAAFKYAILRRHQRSHFLPGVDKLGHRSCPPAATEITWSNGTWCASAFAVSNTIRVGLGQHDELCSEVCTPRKVWIRLSRRPDWSFSISGRACSPSHRPASKRAMFAAVA